MRNRSYTTRCNYGRHRRRFDSLEAIVAHYLEQHACGADEETHFRQQSSLGAAISAAARAKDADGKRYAHQRRIPRAVLEQVEIELQLVRSALGQAGSYEELHEIVDEAIRPIHGVGALLIYDTAFRIGAWRRLRPRHVFLHAGVTQGARALGLPTSQGRLTKRELPRPLRRLAAYQIEDVLCIYKDDLRRISWSRC